jgi:hypothetical protein
MTVKIVMLLVVFGCNGGIDLILLVYPLPLHPLPCPLLW